MSQLADNFKLIIAPTTTQTLFENLSQNVESYRFTELPFQFCSRIQEPQNNKSNFYSSFVQLLETDSLLSNLHEVIYKNTKKTNTIKLYESILDNLNKECEEERYEVFDEIARTNAKKILNFLCEKLPEHDYDICSTEEREIDIYCNPCKGRGMLIICDSEGGIAYFKTCDGRSNRYRCQDIIDFPFDQLYKEFESFRNPTEKHVLYDNNSNIEIFKMLNNEYRCA